MSFDQLRENLPNAARDIKLNLTTVLTVDGAPGLTINQIHGVALACAYQTKNQMVIEAIKNKSVGILSPEEIEAARAAAIIMAMNNVYYRFSHTVDDPELKNLPARLRMNVIGAPGINKVDFELYCLAVSAINGCAACVNSHTSVVKKSGLSNEAVHSSVRIASVISAFGQALA